MKKEKIIEQTAQFVKEKLTGEGSGHDWWHIYRVWKMALHIAKNEKADLYIVELGSLLHDIADYKFYNGDETIGPKAARKWLVKLQVDEKDINQVIEIIKHISFKGAKVKNLIQSLEGKIVQDADRLDAIGAIGITRTFAYGGYSGREIYNPTIKPTLHSTSEQYKSNTSPTLNHFYEKLLLLKDLMNTKTAKQIAYERHLFMEDYLKRFYNEWEGKK